MATFAPVASLSHVPIEVAIAGIHKYAVHLMDVITAFLRSKLMVGIPEGPAFLS